MAAVDAHGGSGMQKRVLSVLFLAVVTVFTSSTTLFAASQNLKIALILWRGETEGEQGLKDGLTELGYTVHYTIMNAGQDRKELGRLLRIELEPRIDDFDYVYTFGTTASLATKAIVNNRVPHIFNIVADPLGAGLVPSMESSGGNFSGVSNGIPVPLQIETALKVMPIKRLGILFNPREQNSMAMRQQIYNIAKALNFEVIDLRSAPTQDMLQENLQKLIDKSIVIDAVYVLSDSFMVSNAQLIGRQLRAAKVKSFAPIKDFVTKGILMGLVPNYYVLGKEAAKIIDSHQRGIKLQDIPIVTVKEPRFVINTTTANLLEMTIPEEILKKALIIE
jgi:putative ABC transport system substrate-binding protein